MAKKLSKERQKALAEYDWLCCKHDFIKSLLLRKEFEQYQLDHVTILLQYELKTINRLIEISEEKYQWVICTPIDGSSEYLE